MVICWPSDGDFDSEAPERTINCVRQSGHECPPPFFSSIFSPPSPFFLPSHASPFHSPPSPQGRSHKFVLRGIKVFFGRGGGAIKLLNSRSDVIFTP